MDGAQLASCQRLATRITWFIFERVFVVDSRAQESLYASNFPDSFVDVGLTFRQVFPPSCVHRCGGYLVSSPAQPIVGWSSLSAGRSTLWSHDFDHDASIRAQRFVLLAISLGRAQRLDLVWIFIFQFPSTSAELLRYHATTIDRLLCPEQLFRVAATCTRRHATLPCASGGDGPLVASVGDARLPGFRVCARPPTSRRVSGPLLLPSSECFVSRLCGIKVGGRDFCVWTDQGHCA